MSKLSNHRGGINLAILLVCGFVATLSIGHAKACGPFFPEEVIAAGDQRILDLPVGDFTSEMDRLLPAGASTLKSVQSAAGLKDPSVYELSAKVDEDDLRAALQTEGVNAERIETIVDGYTQARSALSAHAQAVVDQGEKGLPLGDVPKLIAPPIPDGLPPEFADYLRGLVAYQAGDLPSARAAWTGLLNRPENERRQRTTWAAFMMGRSYQTENPAEARAWFVTCRALVSAGWADSLGLAASSLGWEAKADLADGRFVEAMNLYLKQFWSGDATAAMSLRESARRVFTAGPKALADTARDDMARRVITAYILCDAGKFQTLSDKEKQMIPPWLAAVKSAAPRDMPGADRLAWAAYRSGDFTSAGEWADRARTDEPMARWVRAKLLLRNGDAKGATQVLAALVKSFPPDAQWLSAEKSDRDGLDYTIYLTTDGKAPSIIPEAVSDLAILKLSRGEYVESMDLLLRADFWIDAAYVAERVLSADELKIYVDAHFPESAIVVRTPPIDKWSNMFADNQKSIPAEIRYLLGRRLARLGRWKEARTYLPAGDVRDKFDSYIAAIRDGHDEKLPSAIRAAAFMKAARLAHDSGMEMLGTELEPDYFCYGGSFDFNDADDNSPFSERATLTSPSKDEIARYKENAPADNRRFHYRYIAAEHAWAAAQLMPDDTEETAEVLYEGGCWLKNRDPKLADRFYKALVRRCPYTALGKDAAEKHWFPSTNPPQ